MYGADDSAACNHHGSTTKREQDTTDDDDDHRLPERTRGRGLDSPTTVKDDAELDPGGAADTGGGRRIDCPLGQRMVMAMASHHGRPGDTHAPPTLPPQSGFFQPGPVVYYQQHPSTSASPELSCSQQDETDEDEEFVDEEDEEDEEGGEKKESTMRDGTEDSVPPHGRHMLSLGCSPSSQNHHEEKNDAAPARETIASEHPTSAPPAAACSSGLSPSEHQCGSNGDIGSTPNPLAPPSPLLLPPSSPSRPASAAVATQPRHRHIARFYDSASSSGVVTAAGLGPMSSSSPQSPSSSPPSAAVLTPSSSSSAVLLSQPTAFQRHHHFSVSSSSSETANLFSRTTLSATAVTTPLLESACLACGEVVDRSLRQMFTCATPACRRCVTLLLLV